jgi:hypothetical protein
VKKEQVLFVETQRFNQWWIWTIILGVLGICIYAKIKTVQLNESLFNGSDFSLIIPIFLLPAIFYFLKLKTSMDEKGIYVQFIPFHFKEILLLEIN